MVEQKPLPPRLARLSGIGRAYVRAAIHTLNVVVLFVAVNLACLAFFALRPSPPGNNPATFPRDKLHVAYGDMPMDVVEGTLDENWVRLRYVARPWVHFGEAEFKGEVRQRLGRGGAVERGARGAVGAGKPFRVLAFGGSTMFGYGVPDWETIPAHLERALQARHPGRAIEVVNHGHCFFWSTQEMALFESLLRRDERPDAVVFLDGLNEAAAAFSEGDEPHFDEPARMSDVREMFDRWHAPPDTLPARLPIVRMIQRLRDHETRLRSLTTLAARDEEAWAAQGPRDAEIMLRMYLQNQQGIADAARAAGVDAHFFWQPVPIYAYDLRRMVFDANAAGRHKSAAQALYAMAEERKPPRLVNLSRMLETYEKPAYVDLHHYAPEVCRMIGERMAEQIPVPDP